MTRRTILLILLSYCIYTCNSNDAKGGPDPWHHEDLKGPDLTDEIRLPPDLRAPLQKEKSTDTKFGWWFKRLLTIVLKSGQVKKSDEDGSVDVSLQMRFEENKWKELHECLISESTLSDVMFRRAVGYVEEGIYKPTITNKIVMAWSDYIQVYLTEYKTTISWFFGILGGLGIFVWLWQHVSHKHAVMLILAVSYIYEVIISYKEAEQQEYEKFLSALNTCKWNIWKWIDGSECAFPSPDPLSFMKHMNPLKIAIRMFTSLVCEPIVVINTTIKITLHDITDGLWFPFDKIVYGLLIVVINISLIYLLVMIVFNFIFNIPFNLNFLGIVRVGVTQNKRSLFSTSPDEHHAAAADSDRISGDRLDKLLNAFSLALNNQQNKNSTKKVVQNVRLPKLPRSSSTGRLPMLLSSEIDLDNKLDINSHLRKRYTQGRGEGDH
ncbi:unnamed protein product [Arctia plantaginis]|uniref:Chloride channel CLIC-like protein 1 n=1 Tax=Arctia plantaginis TaxID=874455 RepID=A0A8S1AD47_ARCPL|nr:unnamed protein product [Arctia plantaginis]